MPTGLITTPPPPRLAGGTDLTFGVHLGGLVFGFVYWRYGLRLEDYWNRIARLRWPRVLGPRRNLRLHAPPAAPQDDFDGRVDDILRKLRQEGESSLTAKDRRVLQAAAQRYKNRPRN